MRIGALIVAGSLGFGAAGASANPLTQGTLGDRPAAMAADELPLAVHHKPDHRGGPPRSREHQPEFLYQRPGLRRQFCRTTYETIHDHVLRASVNRPVQTCSYGY